MNRGNFSKLRSIRLRERQLELVNVFGNERSYKSVLRVCCLSDSDLLLLVIEPDLLVLLTRVEELGSSHDCWLEADHMKFRDDEIHFIIKRSRLVVR